MVNKYLLQICSTCSFIEPFPEIVEHGENGFLLETIGQDKSVIVEAIKKKIDYFYTDYNQVEKMGKYSKDIVEKKFSIRVRNEKLKTIYDAV